MSSQSNKYIEALALDVNLLSLVVERNRKQHSRAAYFRRLDMLIRSIKRHKIVIMNSEQNQVASGDGGSARGDSKSSASASTRASDSSDGDSIDGNNSESGPGSLGELIGKIKEGHDNAASIVERYKGAHKRRGRKTKIQEEQWSLEKSNDENEENTTQTSPFFENLTLLHAQLTSNLSEILSRIMYAASALYNEISRGYFAPLCTVALACISRIRVIILRLGRDGTIQFEKTISWLQLDYLAIITQGGELEKKTGLKGCHAKRLLANLNVKANLMNKFIDPGEQVGISAAIIEGDSSKSTDLTQMEKDAVGELVDNSAISIPSGNNLPNVGDGEEIDPSPIDRNLKMLALLKEKRKDGKGKTKSAKKRKPAESEIDDRPSKSKRKKDKKTNTDGERSDMGTKKKKKKKSKKKGNVIDDIFDEF